MIERTNILVSPLAEGPGGILPRGTRLEVFSQIYWVFLLLGTLVGIVVIAYMLYNAYKYRGGTDDERKTDIDRPSVGELPTGSGGGRKLFLSFGLSTIIVVSLIVWTYGTLLYVEGDEPFEGDDQLEVQVEGYQFGWEFTYPNNESVDGELRVPEGATVKLVVTSRDVFHNIGIPAFRVKTDAIPGQTSDTWFVADETGEYEAQCYELCGAGHTHMTADVIVMEQDAFDDWYENTTENSTAAENTAARTA